MRRSRHDGAARWAGLCRSPQYCEGQIFSITINNCQSGCPSTIAIFPTLVPNSLKTAALKGLLPFAK
ncbi:hypothetical protein AV530_018239 [Patagioenas fasciata monilis]|uniref:Uncharacterized protein n=1 Tax=Patagioenas fasciata monilis TaxID=372326 RepID=A0A1V4JR62_PATFA|nr:hypothetical protein AV530_018239 [Patagioenas fasciata monilis]